MARHGRLDGSGFIVLNARDHAGLEEFAQLEDAQAEAGIMVGGHMLQGSGCVIIYAPVAVVRPAVNSNVRVAPSELMAQIGAMMKKVGDGGKVNEPLTPPDTSAPPNSAE